MTSVLTDQQRNVVRIMKQKPQSQKSPNDSGREETRSFLKFSRENLSLSNSDLEQGFNKTKFRVGKHTIISVTALVLALACVGVEICRLKWIVDNTKEIEILKRDVDTLKHRLLEEDLLDELKAFEEKLYSEGSEDDEDLGMENGDYDYNYDDESHDYTDDYHALGLATQSSNLPQGSKPTNTSDHDLDEILIALRKMEIKRSRDLEKCLREKIKNVEKEKTMEEKKEAKIDKEGITGSVSLTKLNLSDHQVSSDVKQKRSIFGAEEVDDYQSDHEPIYEFPKELSSNNNQFNQSGSPKNRLNLDLTHVTINKNDTKAKNDSTGLTSRDKPQLKKFFAKTRSEVLQSTKEHNENSENDSDSPIIKKEGPGIKKNRKKLLWKRVKQDNAKIRKLKENLKEAIASRSHSRGITRRHLKVPRQVFAVHYGGDSSLFSDEDEHTGNGRAKHSEGVFKAWQPSDWVAELGMSKHFFLSENGKLTVQEPGLYLAYAQIHYLDEHDENGFHMLVNGRPILQCMVYSPGTGHKSRSCFSAQITVLQSGDHVVLKDVASARYTLFQKDKSFFGLVKLGDWRQQQKHQRLEP